MQVQGPHQHLELPEGMRSRLEAFRRRVWLIKLAEGLLAAAVGLLLSYLTVFALDRFWDTPVWLRVVILITGTAGLAFFFPLKCHRWIWRTRKLEQVARLLRHKFPRLGDQLLGIVELVQSEVEQERSVALCRAAMRQVAQEVQRREFHDAVPQPRYRRWGWAAGASLVIALAILVSVPAAGMNALMRWLWPWQQIDRYTFAQLGDLPDKLVVPYAESFTVDAELSADSSWAPRQASARYGKQDPIKAPLKQGGYRFELPPQKEAGRLAVAVGDAQKSVAIEPTVRPELVSMTAHVKLPEYLQYTSDLTKDVRGGAVSLVKGSRATFSAHVSRRLEEAIVDGNRQQVAGQQMTTATLEVAESTDKQFSWRDHLGLAAKEPFVLSITAQDDETPMLLCSKLSREQVVLDEDVLSFKVLAQDDFGIQSVGMEWMGIEDPTRNPHPAEGEKVVSAGSPEQRELDAIVTFSAKREGVKPQSLKIRLFTVDYLPDRERVYSPIYVLHVLSPEEHAIWLTHQLRKWFRQAQDVYEREQQLYETNKELRGLSADALDQPENRRRIETQAAAERSNARRLGALTGAGEWLIQQAARNDQFNVATLENWAAMLKTLNDIAGNRMPSVADLLKSAAAAPGNTAQGQPGQAQPGPPGSPPPPQVGVNRDGRSQAGKSGKSSKVPSISDVESGFNELDDAQEEDADEEQEDSQSGGRLTLPSTVIQGGGPPQEKQPPSSSPAQQQVEQAVEEQEDLLAEFAKVADELQKILNNLEGSTFVKRLKAASRRQLDVAQDLNSSLHGNFGAAVDEIDNQGRLKSEQIAEREVAQSDVVYVIQEDLEAYYNRVQQGKFKTVLNEMRDEEVVHNLRRVADVVEDSLHGQAIAQAEFWSDALDRWAEQLVGPG